MQPFFEFLADKWWLIFVFMGPLAAAGGWWQEQSRRRHKRRLEIIRAKAELKTLPHQGPGEPPALTRPAPVADQLEKLFAAQEAVTARWLDYELDVAKLIAYPAMSDGRQPLTAVFIRAQREAQALRPSSSDAKVTAEQVERYRVAVTDMETAFELAEREARRVKDSGFTEAERSRLATAQRLLNVAVDDAATPAERQVAYKRVCQELDGLIAVSDAADEVLQKKVGLQLPPGAASA